MKIAIFSDQFYPELSGIPDSIGALGKELGRRGHRVRFYVPRYSKHDYHKSSAHEKDTSFGVNVEVVRFPSFAITSPSGQGRGVIPAPWDWGKVRSFHPDVIHTQMNGGMGINALCAARQFKIPLVGTNHTAIRAYREFYPIKTEWFADFLLKFSNWYYGKCDFVSAPSQSVADEMREFGFVKECHTVSNPIDTETFCSLPNKKWLREQFGLSDKAVIFASHLSAEKNIDVLIRAMTIVTKEIPDAQLAVAGHGPSEKELRDLAASQGITHAVKFLGFINKPSLAEAYNASKAFVIASTAETQSMVMMQAMAAELPIIAAESRALPEYVNHKNGFLVEPGNAAAFAEKIIYLLRHPAERKKLGEGGRELAETCSVPAIAETWEKIYENLVKSYNKGTSS